ncbi:proton channel OtopLc-like [Ornithodoros turicata]|uniref:proton channel OtopLc-like n=1 Tax=Ornithodoros turicata TaxID=34597 RepID=UPI0031387A4E
MSKTITFDEASAKVLPALAVVQKSDFRPHSSSFSGRIGGWERSKKRVQKTRSSSLSSDVKPKCLARVQDCDSDGDVFLGVSTIKPQDASTPDEKRNGNVYVISSGQSSPVNPNFGQRSTRVTELDSVSRSNVRRASTAESIESNDSFTRLNFATLLSLIYAIFIVSFGCVLSASYHGYAFIDKSTNDIFSSVVAVIGLGWLLFLHVDLTRYKRHILASIKKNLKEYEVMSDRFSLATECVINGQYEWKRAVEDDEEEQVKPHYRFLKGRHSGSFFLKAGMAVFCSGHIIHEGLMLSKEAIHWHRGHEKCGDIVSLVVHSLRPLFSFYQLFIAFKYSNIVINRYKELARFGVMHLIATSLHAWFSTIVDDAVASHNHFVHFEEYHSENLTSKNETEASVCLHVLSPSLSSAAYLYPCTIEFNIILAGVWFIVWQNIGNVHLHSKSHHLEQKFNGADGSMEIHYESNLVISADCHSANKGLFTGILVLLTSIISMVIFFVLLNTHSNLSVMHDIYDCQEGTLTILGLIACILAYFKITKLDRNAHPVMFLDNFLLFIPVPFYMINAVLCIIADMRVGAPIRIGIRVFSLLQIVVQTPILIDGLRRCSNCHRLRYKKPGREIITFLLILNVTQWIVYTVQQKHAEDLLAAKEVYGNLWLFIGHATIPMMLFYRFHSAVCLADIWQSAYHKGE